MARARILAAVLLLGVSLTAAPDSLLLYFIDVEGGQSTLIVTPSGESLLVDTGYDVPGRDANRIIAAMHDAGVSQVDHLLITHFHMDHMGGLPELAVRVPILRFYDHGGLVDRSDPSVVTGFTAYEHLRSRAEHIIPTVGSKLPIKDVDVEWVSSDGRVISTPLPGGGQRNAACPATAPEPTDTLENPRSTGFYLRFGAFRFVDLGDLTGDPLHAVMCPNALLGPVDLLLAPHHAGDDAAHPSVLAPFSPLAVIANNGPGKGNGVNASRTLQRLFGNGAVWQLHKSASPAVSNVPDSNIVNLNDSTHDFLKVIATKEGSFTVISGRSGRERRYRRERR
jgi:beta-lactamase superfamily II metal-dependent hydrolase